MTQLVTLTSNSNGCFTAPSGRELGAEELELVRRLCLSGSLLWNEVPIILNCGYSSRHYVNLRPKKDQDTLRFVGQTIARRIQQLQRDSKMDPKKIPCLVGVPTAGTPLALAAVLNPCLGQTLHYEIMREKPRDHVHGLDQTWAGPPDDTQVQILVENVCTSSSSIETAARRMWKDGHDPDTMHYLIGVDRGGADILRQKRFKNVTALIHMEDALPAAVYLGLREEWVYADYLSEKRQPLLI